MALGLIFIMKHILIVILFCGCSLSLLSQVDLADNEKYCSQYKTVIEFITKDSLARKVFDSNLIKLKINNTINYGIGAQVMISYYIKGTLNIDQISSSDSAVKTIWIKTSKEEKEFSQLTYNSNCLKEIIPFEQNPSIEIKLSRKSYSIVFVEASIIKNKPSYGKGVFYLFFFSNEGQINSIFKKDFIE